MLEDLNVRLTRAFEKKRLKQRLERELNLVDRELQEKSARLESLSIQLEKEKVDVEKLEQMSIAALIQAVRGRREEKLQKERRDLLSAQLRYQQTRRRVEYLEQEYESLMGQLSLLKVVESEVDLLLSEKEYLLRQSNQAVASKLLEISEQIAELKIKIKEISEAITAGNDVLSGLEQIIESLESAKNWGIWDMLGGDLIVTAIKHSRIDDARDAIQDVQINMGILTRELADVQKSGGIHVDIDGLATFADFFLDGLIIDWIVQSRIVESLEQTKEIKDLVVQAVKQLEDLKKVSQKKREDLEDKRAHIIKSA